MGASPAAQLPPPPSGDSQSTSPGDAGASPAPATPAPQMQQGTQMIINLVSAARAIAKAFPAAAPEMAEVNDLVRKAMGKIMSSQQTGEPEAPPSGG